MEWLRPDNPDCDDCEWNNNCETCKLWAASSALLTEFASGEIHLHTIRDLCKELNHPPMPKDPSTCACKMLSILRSDVPLKVRLKVDLG